jgi:hypothetical protein
MRLGQTLGVPAINNHSGRGVWAFVEIAYSCECVQEVCGGFLS